MALNNRFYEVFKKTPVIGMLHLAGRKPVERALEDLAVFEEEGVDGAIVENYHGSEEDAVETLQAIKKSNMVMPIGVNILPNEFELAFELTERYGAEFVQIDHVAGAYNQGRINAERYAACKETFPDVVVLGGVWPKYYTPLPSSSLPKDLEDGAQRAEAIVVTGTGTGKETPLDKIKSFREILGTHPLVVGAGLTPSNAYEQLSIADGAVVGSYFKGGDTAAPVQRRFVRELMTEAEKARAHK